MKKMRMKRKFPPVQKRFEAAFICDVKVVLKRCYQGRIVTDGFRRGFRMLLSRCRSRRRKWR
jgi:hypothetical protein